ncbi:mixed lineage protein kinase [Haematococcus lacustris]
MGNCASCQGSAVKEDVHGGGRYAEKRSKLEVFENSPVELIHHPVDVEAAAKAAVVKDVLAEPGVAPLGQAYQPHLQGPPLPPCEEGRQMTMQLLGKMDAPADAELETILKLVRSIFQAPTALVALFSDRHIRVIQGGGLFDRGDVPWRQSFCAWTMASQQNQVMVINDAQKDARFADNPFVQGSPGVRHYVGAPLVAANGHRLGSLCYIDTKPRELDPGQALILGNMAEMVVRHIEKDISLQLRSADNRELNKAYGQLKRAVDCVDQCVVLLDTSVPGWRIAYVNSAWDRVTGGDRSAVQGDTVACVLKSVSGAAVPQPEHEAAVAQGLSLEIEGVVLCNPGLATVSSAYSSTATCGPKARSGDIRSNGSEKITSVTDSRCTEYSSYSSADRAPRLVLKLRPASEADSGELAIGAPAYLYSRQNTGLPKLAGTQHLYFMTVEAEASRKVIHNSRRVGSAVLTHQEGNAPVVEGLDLGALLGRGAYGSVYAGNWYGTQVAVKVVDQDVRSLQACGASMEAILGTELRHPHIVSTLKYVVSHVKTNENKRMSKPGVIDSTSPHSRFTDDTAISASLPNSSRDISRASTDLVPSKPLPQATACPAAPRAASPVIPTAPEDVIVCNSGFNSVWNSKGPSLLSELLHQLPQASKHNSSAGDTSSDAEARAQTWIVMEMCDHGCLQDAVERGWLQDVPSSAKGKPKMSAIVATAYEIASALSYLHSHGVVHGDLSAWNVLLSSQGVTANVGKRGFTVKVADFGLAHSLDTATCVHTLNYGTITHQPPETLMDGQVSRETDTYSLGVLMWQMYTGSRPWAGLSHSQILMTVVNGTAHLAFPADTPGDYLDLATACLSYDVSQRPSIADVVKALAAMRATWCT